MTATKFRVAVQRAASLLHLPQVLDEFGAPLASVLDGTGI